ncbi:MAG: hypothetical protein PHW69_02620 [Elusimicrobiaceae bacterium]|nr:hypothetical protein [Elusimicrobiaceae bacterium]
MNTPLLSDTCSIETLLPSYSAETGESAGQWSTLAENVPCRLRQLSADETLRGRAVFKRASYALYIPSTELDPALTRVKYSGRVFRVDGARDMGGRKRLTALYLEEYR